MSGRNQDFDRAVLCSLLKEVLQIYLLPSTHRVFPEVEYRFQNDCQISVVHWVNGATNYSPKNSGRELKWERQRMNLLLCIMAQTHISNTHIYNTYSTIILCQ